MDRKSCWKIALDRMRSFVAVAGPVEIGRKRNGRFGVADGNKRKLAHWNHQRQFDPEIAAFAFLGAIYSAD
jgi:hypothetical protein